MKKLTLLVAATLTAMSSFATVTWSNLGVEIGGDSYAYAGYAESDVTNGNKLTITYTGDITSIRFEDAKPGTAGVVWFDQENQSSYFKTVDDSAIPATGDNTTIEINLISAGFAGCTAFHVHSGGAGNMGKVTISAMNITYDSSLSGEVEAKWTSQDGTVKVYSITDVNGNVMEDLSYPNPIYWYDTYANAWKTEYPAVNQNFTFAIEAKDDATKAFCDYTGATDCTPTFGIHMWDQNGGLADEQSGDFRVERIGSTYVYGVDMNASALKGSQGGSFQLGVCGADESLSENWFNVTIAFIGDETAAGEEAAWYKAITSTLNLDYKAAQAVADVMPALDAEWAETVGCSLLAGVNPVGTSTDIKDVIAESVESGKAVKAIVDGQVVIVKGEEVYNVLGAKMK